MIQNKNKSEREFLNEVERLRQRVAELESLEEKRRSIEKALRENERFLDDVFNSIQDGISVLDKDLVIRRVNRMMNEWYSRNRPLEGKKCFQCYHDADKACSPCPSIRCLQSGNAEQDIVPGLPGSPVEWVELFSFPIKDMESGEVTGVVEFVRDITRRKRVELALKKAYDELEHRVVERTKELSDANEKLIQEISERRRSEQERQKLEKQLLHAQKMESIGTLAGGIAHDFNNILGAIIGYSELCGDDIPDDTQAKQSLLQVLAAADRAKELVKQILTFSRKSEKERKPLLLNHLIDGDLKLLRSTLPSTIEIRSDIAKELSFIMADPTQLHQVIMNLCTNAAHAMRESGGILEISLKEIHLDALTVPGKNLEPGKYLQLTISDTGHGIPHEIKSRIFEPYYTTKKPGEGTGMGLAVVHGIVKSHGGDISVYSETGKGTVFHIFLPVTETESPPVVEKIPPLKGSGERILYVDDEQFLYELGKQMLTKLGYEVHTERSSTTALETFKKNPGGFDLVITDQTMPHLTGLELAREIKNIKPDIPVILCSGFSERINEKNLNSQGISAFVMKPINRDEIARVIGEILAGKSRQEEVIRQ